MSAATGYMTRLISAQDEIRLAAALALGYVRLLRILSFLTFFRCHRVRSCEATVGAMGTLLKVVIDNVQQARICMSRLQKHQRAMTQTNVGIMSI